VRVFQRISHRFTAQLFKERKIVIQVDKVVLGEELKIDGCYMLTTDLKKEVSKEKNTLYYIQFM